MPQIKGSLGSIVIASENISQGMGMKKTVQRKGDDPMNYIRV
jgi:hypothetical protein